MIPVIRSLKEKDADSDLEKCLVILMKTMRNRVMDKILNTGDVDTDLNRFTQLLASFCWSSIRSCLNIEDLSSEQNDELKKIVLTKVIYYLSSVLDPIQLQNIEGSIH